ncbi:MAG: lipocalin-like domain-containing protein [Patescibacteria group bacterium]|jgi:predicted secreted hydrolase
MHYKPIHLPQDEKSHKSIIEWWYFNGYLNDSAGRRYTFMDCLFKADLKRAKIPYLKILLEKTLNTPYIYFAHSVVSDITKQKTYKDIQNISIMSGDSFKRPLLYANYFDPLLLSSGYINCEIAETKASKFHLKNSKLDLSLSARKKPLFEGGQGFINVCQRKSYYYSLTDLAVKGTINIDNKPLEVTGHAWMDHQWADVAYNRDAWSWFSLKLSDGTDIMCIEYRIGEQRDYLVDIIDKRGNTEHYNYFILKPSKKIFTSLKTKAKYPLEWEIEIPNKKIKLKLKAMLRDQEMVFGAINYWEGPLDISGTVKNKKIKGVGFMELVGYQSDYNFLALVFENFNHKLGRSVLKKIKKIL